LDNDFIFIIEDVKSGYKPVGQVSLYNIDWDAKRAEYGRLMIGDQDSTGRGFARLATEVLLDLAFKKLGLEEVYLEVFANNDRAIRIYEAAGFSIMEGNGNTIRMHILGKV
jgi:RimJ/RimL family protein N-acetyltransferase